MLKFRHFFTNSRIPGYKFLRHVIYPPISSLRDIKNHLLYQISSLLLPGEVPPSDRNDRMPSGYWEAGPGIEMNHNKHSILTYPAPLPIDIQVYVIPKERSD